MILSSGQIKHYKELMDKSKAGRPLSRAMCNDLFDTIEALQQANEQLQAQNGAMRQQLEIIKANIHEFPPEGMTIGKQIWIETTDAALSTTRATYHNPADVAALEKALGGEL